MYQMLTFRELTALRHVLFEGTEEAFSVAAENRQGTDSTQRHRAAHEELAHLFIEVATELLRRLEHAPLAA